MKKDVMTRYELARIIGLRALQLSEGVYPLIDTTRINVLDTIQIATREVYERKLDIRIQREEREVELNDMVFPTELYSLIETYDQEIS